jgi:hypothetical protein
MKTAILFLFLYECLSTIVRIDKTKNNYKLCKDCKNFLPTMYGDKFDIGNHMGRCNLYGKINLISGEIDHEYASIARSFSDMCGINATYFENLDTSELGVHNYPL